MCWFITSMKCDDKGTADKALHTRVAGNEILKDFNSLLKRKPLSKLKVRMDDVNLS